MSAYNDTNAYIRVGAGAGNTAFNLIEGDTVSAKGVSASALVSALMSHSEAEADIADFLVSVANINIDDGEDKYATNAVSFITLTSGKQYIGFEPLAVGVASILDVTPCNIAQTKGTGLKLTTVWEL